MTINIEITKSNISASHRLPNKCKQPNSNGASTHPVIIARLVNRDVRNAIFSKRKSAKHVNIDKLPVQEMKKLYINENLAHVNID